LGTTIRRQEAVGTKQENETQPPLCPAACLLPTVIGA